LTNIALGMTKDEVKKIESSQLIKETKNDLMYINKNVFDFSAKITYQFENNKLTKVFVFHDVVDNRNDIDLLESYYVVMYNNFYNIYGTPVYFDTNWMDDGNGYSIVALWEAVSHDTFLSVKINLDSTSFGGFSISSN